MRGKGTRNISTCLFTQLSLVFMRCRIAAIECHILPDLFDYIPTALRIYESWRFPSYLCKHTPIRAQMRMYGDNYESARAPAGGGKLL